MDKNIDHINAQKKRIEGGILPLLGWTLGEYLDFKMRSGCTFLQNYMPKYPGLIDEVLEKPNYWKWWSNAWLLRDEAFLMTENVNLFHQSMIRQMYRALHNPYTLTGDLVVDSIVFEGTAITQKPKI